MKRGQTEKQTSRLYESIGPEGRYFEKTKGHNYKEKNGEKTKGHRENKKTTKQQNKKDNNKKQKQKIRTKEQ